MNAIIDSKDQNRINTFMACMYQVNEANEVLSNMQTARLAYYNMSLEAQKIACEKYKAEFKEEWR